MLLPDLEIRARLSRYLAGSVALDEFEDWFIAETWDAERYGEGGARLAAEIRTSLFRISTGEMSEEDFRALARKKVDEIVPNLDASGPKMDTEARTHDAVKLTFG